jgi:HD-GYP domain-containing protein (c-di-GMP phosphodiesterase class II)
MSRPASVRRTPVPARIRWYAAAAAVLALALLPLTVLHHGAVRGWSAYPIAAALAVLMAWAARNPVTTGAKIRADIGAAPAVAAVLVLPGPLAAAAIIAGRLCGEWFTTARPVQRIFNAATAGCKASTGVLVYVALLGLRPHDLFAPVAAFGAAGAMYLTDMLLVIGIASVQLRENPLRRTLLPPRESASIEALLAATGVLAAAAISNSAWTLPLLAAPAVAAQRALRDGVALRAQTRLALEEIADIVDMRDHYTFEHSKRVAELARVTARKLALNADDIDLIWMAGRVHDVGKIGIKSSVLLKPGRLTEDEFDEMRTHPEVGARLIARFPQFARGGVFVLHHHERWDGKGYPGKLRGEQIPFGARVLAVADAWDAMTSHRAYRKALPLEVVQEELRRGRGAQFDPRVLDAFLQVLIERPDLAVFHTETEQAVDAGIVATPVAVAT